MQQIATSPLPLSPRTSASRRRARGKSLTILVGVIAALFLLVPLASQFLSHHDAFLEGHIYASPTNVNMDQAWSEIVSSIIKEPSRGSKNETSRIRIHSNVSSFKVSVTLPATTAPSASQSTDDNYFTGAMKEHLVFKIKSEVKKGNTSNLPKIPVVAYPYFEFGIRTAENQHIEENGLRESKFLELSTDVENFDPNVVWVGDTGYPHQWGSWCRMFLAHISAAQKKRSQLGLSHSWPIYIVDFTDASIRQRCPNIEGAVGKHFVHYSKRSRVSGRSWSSNKGWVQIGQIMDLSDRGRHYLHTPLVVRTDTIENLQHVLHERGMNLSFPIETIERKVDVTHLWPVDETGVGTIESRLRTTVSRYLDKLQKESNLKIHVGLAGRAVRQGRRGVKSEYIDAMLATKILVVTQRDKWQDHYRLFEGLVSGAMVMTDHMLAKPVDIVNGTSIVDFTSLTDLKAKIDYYLEHTEERLAIARRGRFAAMMRHRTWHRIEEIIFGDILTNCTRSPDCPFIVHANEGRR